MYTRKDWNWPVKQPLGDLALKFSTGLILFRLHGENRLLFFLSPEVALANIMKLPSSPPGEHCSGSCCEKFQINSILLIDDISVNLDIIDCWGFIPFFIAPPCVVTLSEIRKWSWRKNRKCTNLIDQLYLPKFSRIFIRLCITHIAQDTANTTWQQKLRGIVIYCRKFVIVRILLAKTKAKLILILSIRRWWQMYGDSQRTWFKLKRPKILEELVSRSTGNGVSHCCWLSEMIEQMIMACEHKLQIIDWKWYVCGATVSMLPFQTANIWTVH